LGSVRVHREAAALYEMSPISWGAYISIPGSPSVSIVTPPIVIVVPVIVPIIVIVVIVVIVIVVIVIVIIVVAEPSSPRSVLYVGPTW